MRGDDYYDYLINPSYEWMPSNIYHDDYCAKKNQDNASPKKAPKEKKSSRLGLLLHKIIFEKILHVKYADYITWYANNSSNQNDSISLRAWAVRLLSIAFIPIGYFVTFGLGVILQQLYNVYENAVFPLLTLAILAFCIAVIIGTWKASTIEFEIISSAKSKAQEVRLATSKQQHKKCK